MSGVEVERMTVLPQEHIDALAEKLAEHAGSYDPTDLPTEYHGYALALAPLIRVWLDEQREEIAKAIEALPVDRGIPSVYTSGHEIGIMQAAAIARAGGNGG